MLMSVCYPLFVSLNNALLACCSYMILMNNNKVIFIFLCCYGKLVAWEELSGCSWFKRFQQLALCFVVIVKFCWVCYSSWLCPAAEQMYVMCNRWRPSAVDWFQGIQREVIMWGISYSRFKQTQWNRHIGISCSGFRYVWHLFTSILNHLPINDLKITFQCVKQQMCQKY